jgi:hypothetical protein
MTGASVTTLPLPEIRVTSLWQMAEESPELETDLVDAAASATLSQWVGMTESGKSAGGGILFRAALTGGTWLGQSINYPISRVVLLMTDPGSAREYRDRMETVGTDTRDLAIQAVRVPRGATAGQLQRVTEEVHAGEVVDKSTLVVVDHFGGVCAGRVSNPEVTGPVIDWMIKFTEQGAPTIFLHHSSEKFIPGTKQRPTYGMGDSYIRIYTRQTTTFTKFKRNGRDWLKVAGDGNGGRKIEIEARWGKHALDLEVMSVKRSDELHAEHAERAAKDALDQSAAQWLVSTHPRTGNKDKAGGLLVAQFPDLAPNAKNPARQVARYLGDEHRGIGRYVHLVGGVWRLRSEG